MKILQKNMSFGEAINALNTGRTVSRIGWNGKGAFLIKNGGYNVDLDSARDPINKEFLESQKCDDLTIEPHIDMWTAQKTLAVGWSPSQMDIFSNDWCVVDPLLIEDDNNGVPKSKYDGMLHAYSKDMKDSLNEGEGDHNELSISGGNAEPLGNNSSRLYLFYFDNDDLTPSKAELNLMALKQEAVAFKIFSDNEDQLKEIISYSQLKNDGNRTTIPIISETYFFLLEKEDTLSDIRCGRVATEYEFTGHSLMIPWSIDIDESVVEKTFSLNILPKTKLYIEFYK